MLKSRSKYLVSATIFALAAVFTTSAAAGSMLQFNSSAMRGSLAASQLQVAPPGAAHICLPNTVTRRAELAYGNSTTRLSEDGQKALRQLARSEWESWVKLHQGQSFSNLAIAADIQSQTGFDTNRGMWWMAVSARPCR